MSKKTVIPFLCALFSLVCVANTKKDRISVRVSVVDANTRRSLEYAIVHLSNVNRLYGGMTDAEGWALMPQVIPGEYKLSVSFLGYQRLENNLRLYKDTTLTLLLTSAQNMIEEVVVTASESKGMSSSSIIDRKAMQHLQPSSFSELLSLLPGGLSQKPSLSSVDQIRLREVKDNVSTHYDISSLGTSFVIDGTPMPVNADMLKISGVGSSSGDPAYKRQTLNKGVDMRTISTDFIERVEIVRGIPSVEYGELTSGLVKIERKKGERPWSARLKVDEFSKLLYVGKGFSLPGKELYLNAGFNLMDAKADPRNIQENFKRVSAYALLEKSWKSEARSFRWTSGLDYTATFDNDKVDPEINPDKIDNFESKNVLFVLKSNLKWVFKKHPFLRSFEMAYSASLQSNRIDRVRFVSLSRPTPVLTQREEGVFDAYILPFQYRSELWAESKPVGLYAKTAGRFGFNTGGISHKILAGLEWRYDKNEGAGEVFDPHLTPYPSTSSQRVRPYKEVPASRNLSFFLGDSIAMRWKGQWIHVEGGIRGVTMPGMDKRYTLSRKVYLDPRVNMRWELPSVHVGNKKLHIEILAGLGWHTKLPTLNQLYPDDLFSDLVQLNYYHESIPEYRRINVRTYVISPVNYELEAARNLKKEIKIDLSYSFNSLSLTVFREKLTSGFRSMRDFISLPYLTYDPQTVIGYPDLEQLAYRQDTALMLYSKTKNGSTLIKEGVEYQLSFRRITALRTKVSVWGAWFRTFYRSSFPDYSMKDIVLDGKELSYAGLYDTNNSYEREQFNTNFMFDTQIPRLSLIFSTTFECLWYTKSIQHRKNGIPFSYVDVAGNEYPYTEADKTHYLRQHLIEKYQEASFEPNTVPFEMKANFKASKAFKEKLRLSVFIQGLVHWRPPYTRKGYEIRRVPVSPYFGMELNINL